MTFFRLDPKSYALLVLSRILLARDNVPISLNKLTRIARRFNLQLSPGEAGARVRRAARMCPGTNCLPQAITAAAILNAQGVSTRLVLGFSDALHKGHASVYAGTTPVIGTELEKSYRVIGEHHT